MTNNDLERVKDDLATIEQAVGLELSFGWVDVWMTLVVAVYCAYAAILFLFSHTHLKLWLEVPAVPIIGIAIWLRWRYRRTTGRSAVRRRGYTFGIVGGLIIAPVMAAYMLWGTTLGVPLKFVLTGITLFFGLGALLLGVLDRRQLYMIGVGISMVLIGVLLPLAHTSRMSIALCLSAFAIGCVVATPLMAWQLHAKARLDAVD